MFLFENVSQHDVAEYVCQCQLEASRLDVNIFSSV